MRDAVLITVWKRYISPLKDLGNNGVSSTVLMDTRKWFCLIIQSFCVFRQLNIDNCNLIEDCEPEEFITKKAKCLNKTKENITLSCRKCRLNCSGSPSTIKWHVND